MAKYNNKSHNEMEKSSGEFPKKQLNDKSDTREHARNAASFKNNIRNNHVQRDNAHESHNGHVNEKSNGIERNKKQAHDTNSFENRVQSNRIHDEADESEKNDYKKDRRNDY